MEKRETQTEARDGGMEKGMRWQGWRNKAKEGNSAKGISRPSGEEN